jgi:hypothetical protein
VHHFGYFTTLHQFLGHAPLFLLNNSIVLVEFLSF